ncbi:hypothetical protein [Pseudomonas asgharzadehiana]|uniref:Uncharacterized protein n=1 Tax=Pseudomonas asgharzadehiana TaxID=2842349 RepID=A0ABX8NVF7_9PSED|nr:hypothetical protein [Pseudomonas asgharzadehiana]QXH65147.1 hypothetical protein KSS96_16090 [Pseudomonas asgharzadehiana]
MIDKISTKAVIIGGSPTLEVIEVQDVIDTAIGLVSRVAATSSLRLLCPSGDFSEDGDWIEIFSRDPDSSLPDAWTRIFGPVQFFGATAGGNISVVIDAPAGSGGFPHGKRRLRHQLFVNDFADPSIPGSVDRPSDVGEYSPEVKVEFDQYTAYESIGNKVRPPAPQYTGSLPAGAPVTAAHLATAGGLPFSIPDNAYAIESGKWHPGDVIRFYWTKGDTALDAEEVGGLVPPRPMLQTGNVFTLPASAITQSGEYKLIYTISDRMDRPGLPSVASRPFTVALAPAPENLQPIIIDQAPDLIDNLLNIADLTPGPTGSLAAYTNFDLTKDQYQIIWGGQPASQWFPVTQFPITLNQALLTPLALADYGTTKGPKPTAVKYNLRRDGEVIDGPTTTINVDFSVTGPDNPGTPGSPNTRLLPVKIFGQGSTELNTLRFAHAGNPVTAEVELWVGADVPAPGMWIHLVWSDGSLVAPPFEITTQAEGAIVRWEFPWSYVAAAGNGIKNVHYFIASTPVPTAADNRNRSPDTPVEVIDAVTSTLVAPRYLGVRGTGLTEQWNCDSLRVLPLTTPNTFVGQIFVPADTRMAEGQQLKLELRLFRPRTGTPIDDRKQTYSVTVTRVIKDNGHTFNIPFSFLKEARLGRAEAVVTVALDDGTTGRGEAAVNIRTTLSTSYCDLSPVVGP